MRSLLLYVEFVYPPTPTTTILTPDQSWLLTGISSFKPTDAHVFGASHLTKSPTLGRLFADLPPKADGSFEMELAVCLPDLFPKLNNHLEYTVDTIDEDGALHQVCLSNQMAMVDYLLENTHLTSLLPRMALDTLPTTDPFPALKTAPARLLKSMASTRFRIEGKDAEDALETQVESAIDKFISCINRLLEAVHMVSDHDSPPLSPSYDRATFDYFYFVLKGESDTRLAQGRLAPNFGRVAMNSPSLQDKRAEALISIACGADQLDDVQIALRSSKASIHGGMLKYALLQMVIAAEIATSRLIAKRVQQQGVSKGKWEDYSDDLKYSIMLNIMLFSIAPPHLKPDRQTIGLVNSARAARNELMHEGTFKLKRQNLLDLHAATSKYIRYLTALAVEFDTPAPTR